MDGNVKIHGTEASLSTMRRVKPMDCGSAEDDSTFLIIGGGQSRSSYVIFFNVQLKIHQRVLPSIFIHFSTTGVLRFDHRVRHSQRLCKKIDCVTSNQDFNSTT